jgi:glucose-6-phosphate 1-dehydrogenase
LADIWKKPANKNGTAMNNSHSDTLVFFGATGDLAYKKIFPALQAMVKRGTSTCRSSAWPRRAGTWTSSKPGPRTVWKSTADWIPRGFEKLSGLLRYVDGDYNDPATFRRCAGNSAGAAPGALPGHPAGGVWHRRRAIVPDGMRPQRPRHHRKPFRPRPRLGQELNQILLKTFDEKADLSH